MYSSQVLTNLEISQLLIYNIAILNIFYLKYIELFTKNALKIYLYDFIIPNIRLGMSQKLAYYVYDK